MYEDRTRYRAKRELAERDSAEVMDALKTWLAGLDTADENFEHQQLEALWVCQTHNQVDEALLQKVLASKDHRARAAGIRVLSFWVDRVENPLAQNLLAGKYLPGTTIHISAEEGKLVFH